MLRENISRAISALIRTRVRYGGIFAEVLKKPPSGGFFLPAPLRPGEQRRAGRAAEGEADCGLQVHRVPCFS